MKLKEVGFTLIELLVVISIIGVLSAVLLANLVGIRSRAADTSLKNNLSQLKTSMRLYYNDHQSYPAATNGVFSECSGSVCKEGSEFNSGSTIYMKEVPAYTDYNLTDNGDGFTVGVLLKNLSDSDIADSVAACNIGSSAVTGVFYICAN